MSLSTELNILTKFIQHFDTTTTLDFLKQLNLHHETGQISIYDYDNTRILIIKKPKSKIWETHTYLQPFYNITSNRHFKKCMKIIEEYFLKNQGHWVLILRYGNVIEFFNSYGLKHSEDDFIDNDELNGYLGQYRLFLDDLLKREIVQQEFDVIYNKVKLQRKHKDVNTCGRHVVLRIICLLHFNMGLPEYLKFMQKASKFLKMDYDEVVTTIIS